MNWSVSVLAPSPLPSLPLAKGPMEGPALPKVLGVYPGPWEGPRA